jgi:anti-repressor protein
MEELIRVNPDTETVSARELYRVLEIESNFTTWFNRMIGYGFSEGKDFFPKMEESTGGRPSTDYLVTIYMARHICMIQRTAVGAKCRDYFSALQDAWNTPEQVMARALKMADHTIESLKHEVTRMKPKEIFADAVSASQTSILIGDLAKLLNQNGVEIGQRRLFTWLRDNGYLMKTGSSKNLPIQRYMEQGLFEIKESTVGNPDGSVRVTKTTKVTGKGQVYFVNAFLRANCG